MNRVVVSLAFVALVVVVLILGFGGFLSVEDETETEQTDASTDHYSPERTGLGESDAASVDVTPVDEFVPPSSETMPGVFNGEPNEFASFEDVTVEAGLVYESQPFGVQDIQGTYVADINNTGYEDVLFVGGEYPTLFENHGGEYSESQTFNITDVQTAHFFDYNNNGYEDLLLLPIDMEPVLYENKGGTFVSSEVQLTGNMSYPSTVTAADFTNNGCLDVYIGNWVGLGGPAMPIEEFITVGQNHPEIRPETETGGQNYLFAGDCTGFTDITGDAGVGGNQWTLAVSAADFTGNGYIDIHVGNDFAGYYIYENQGNATFEPIDLGPASDRNAMSSVAMDMTGNHLLDLFVTNVYYEDGVDIEDLVPLTGTALPDGNNLFVNEGDGTLSDVAQEHGLHRGSWGWAATVADYTNDGHLDIIHGSSYADVAVVDDHPDIFKPPQVWKGTGESWEKVNGFDLAFPKHNIRGLARVDYNNNGVLDFVTLGVPTSFISGVSPDKNRSFLYENTHQNDRSVQLWIHNPNGVDRNAGVYIETDERTIYRETNARADLFSQDSRLIHVGLGSEALERVVVEWPDGEVTAYETLVEGNRYRLTPEQVDLVD